MSNFFINNVVFENSSVKFDIFVGSTEITAFQFIVNYNINDVIEVIDNDQESVGNQIVASPSVGWFSIPNYQVKNEFSGLVETGKIEVPGIRLDPVKDQKILSVSMSLSESSDQDVKIIIGGSYTTSSKQILPPTGYRLTPGVAEVIDIAPPIFTSGDSASPLDENSSIENVVYQAEAIDDSNIALVYSIGSIDDGESFAIDKNTGAVRLKAAADFEAKPGYKFTVVATDSVGNTAEKLVTLAITDINEPPVITDGDMAVNAAPENSVAGTAVGVTAIATDPDYGATITGYSLADNAGGLFAIDETTGVVTVAGTLDYETTTRHTVIIKVTSSDSSAVEEAFIIEVGNVDEAKPIFISGDAVAALAENSGAAQVVYEAKASDTDFNSPNTASSIIYSLKDDGDASLFTIDTITGSVALAANPDFETKSSYSFTVVATDAAGNAAEQVLTLAITDIDEIAPDAPSFDIVAEDDKINAYEQTTIISGTAEPNSSIELTFGTGKRTVVANDQGQWTMPLVPPADIASMGQGSVTLSATSMDAAGNKSNAGVRTVLVDTVLPGVPVITAIDENTGLQTDFRTSDAAPTLTVTAEAGLSTLVVGNEGLQEVSSTYSVVEGSPGTYTITFTDPLPDGVYGIAAVDKAGNVTDLNLINEQSKALFRIDLTSPTFGAETPAAKNENVGINQVVFTAKATDNSPVNPTFSIKDGLQDDAESFAIDSNSGALTLKENPNFEVKNKYNLTLVATDVVGNTAEQVISLDINDINEAPKDNKAPQAPFIVAVGVEQKGGLSVASYFEDPDAGDSLTFSATGLPTGLTLNPDGSLAGTPAQSLDAGTVKATITATDKGNLTATREFDIQVVRAPAVQSIVASVAEAKSGQDVSLTVTLSEKVTVQPGDIPTLTLSVGGTEFTATYSDTDSDPAPSDEVTPPKLVFKGTVGAGDSNAVTITGLSGAAIVGNLTQQVLTSPSGLSILGFLVDNTPPVFASTGGAAFAENGSGVAYVAAANDATAVTYAITGGADQALFSIDGETGEVSFNASPDFELPGDDGVIPNNVYELTITATDNLLQATTHDVAITVTDVNEAPTAVTLTNAGNIPLNENVDSGAGVKGIKLGTITVADDALGDEALTLTGTDAASFEIRKNGAFDDLFFVGKSPNFEKKPQYNVTINADDPTIGAEGSVEANLVFTLNIKDVNDEPQGRVNIIGGMAEGRTLQAVVGSIVDEDGVPTDLNSFGFQWVESSDGGQKWSDIANATFDKLTLTQAQVGNRVGVVVTYKDEGGTPQTVYSYRQGEVVDLPPQVINANDLPSGSLTITGQGAQGQTLTLDDQVSDADGLVDVTKQYQWRADGVNIDGATGNTLLLPQALVGKTISAVVRYTDNGGTAERVLSANAVGPVANANDLPTGAVTISGTPTQGQTLTASNSLADADGMGAVTYQWKAGADVVGTGSTLTLTQAQVGKAITVEASYTDGFGAEESMISTATEAVANINDPPSGGVVISGTAGQGRTLTLATAGLKDADGLPDPNTFQIRWLANGTAIPNATSSTLTLGLDEVGKKITAEVGYTDLGNQQEKVLSAETPAVFSASAQPNSGTLDIRKGDAPATDAQQGDVLTAFRNAIVDTEGINESSVAFRWFADGVAIAGATASSLTLGQAQVGKKISVAMSYTDNAPIPNASGISSDAVGPVANVNDAPEGAVTIIGTATQGQTLTVSNTLSDADGMGVVSYQWKAGQDVIGTGDSLTLMQAQVGKAITVEASYTDGFGAAESKSSAATASVENTNDAPTGAIGMQGYLLVGQTLTADTTKIADADGLGNFTLQWQSSVTGRAGSWTDIAGANAGTLVLDSLQAGERVRLKVTYTDGQGTPETVVSVPTSPVLGSLAERKAVEYLNTSVATYQWETSSDDGANWERVAGASESALKTTDAMGGKLVRAVVNGAEQGTGLTVTAVDNGVGKLDPITSDSADGFVAGATLRVKPPFADPDGIDANGVVSYQWQRFSQGHWSDITGSTTSEYVATEGDAGSGLRVKVSYTDAQSFLATLYTEVVRVTAAPAPAATGTFDAVASDDVLTAAERNAAGGVVLTGTITSADTQITLAIGNRVRKPDVTVVQDGDDTWSYTLKPNDYKALVEGENVLTVTLTSGTGLNKGMATLTRTVFIPQGVLEQNTGNSAVDPTQPKGLAADVQAKAQEVQSQLPEVVKNLDFNAPNIAALPFGASDAFNQAGDAKPEDFGAIKGSGDSSIGGLEVLGSDDNGTFKVPQADGSEKETSLDGDAASFKPVADPLSMTVSGVEPGSTTTVNFFLPANVSRFLPSDLSTAVYYKFNYDPDVLDFKDYLDDAGDPLYQYLLEDTNTNGKRDNGELVTLRLTLTDGDKWDGDGIANGIIVDPGVIGNEPPKIAITSDKASLGVSQTATITFTLTQASLDFVKGDISVSGGSLGDLSTTDNKIYTAVFTPTANSTTAASISVASDKFTNVDGLVNADGADADNALSITVNTVPAPSGGGGSTTTPPVTPPSNLPKPEAEVSVPALTEGGLAGDGNGDGKLDSEQADVVSVALTPVAAGAAPSFVTLVSGSTAGKAQATSTTAVTAFEQKTVAEVIGADKTLPTSFELPLGLVAFTATTDTAGADVEFSLYVDTALGANGYWKLNAQGVWVNLASSAFGGATVVEGGKTRLDFKIEDGGTFDADGKADGVITDPGGAGKMELSLVGARPDGTLDDGFWF